MKNMKFRLWDKINKKWYEPKMFQSPAIESGYISKPKEELSFEEWWKNNMHKPFDKLDMISSGIQMGFLAGQKTKPKEIDRDNIIRILKQEMSINTTNAHSYHKHVENCADAILAEINKK